MSKIAKVFADLKAQGRKGLVPFITAGDPEPGITLDLMHALVRGGADVIELGVPFSDPMADGPVIQRASERALSHGTTLKHCIELVKQFRQTNDHTRAQDQGQRGGGIRHAQQAKGIQKHAHHNDTKCAKAIGQHARKNASKTPGEVLDCHGQREVFSSP